MNVNVFFCENLWDADVLDADILEIPDSVVARLEELSLLFFSWVFDKNNNHDYWVYEDEKKKSVCYGSEAFVRWLNENVLCDEKAKAYVVEQNVQKVDKNLPYLYF